MRIVIMQPTYMPWLGYFALIDQADVFVIYDDVQFSYRSWQRSNRIKGRDGIKKLSLTIDKKNSEGNLINQIKLRDESFWKADHINFLREYYHNSPYYEEIMTLYDNALVDHDYYLWKVNFSLIKAITEYLEIGNDKKFALASDYNVSGNKSQRLINLVHALGGNQYLSSVGAFGYIEEEGLFEKSDIELMYLNFDHPVYSQLHGEFVSHMSVLDLLFNHGKESTAILRSGIKPPLSPEALTLQLESND